MERESIEKSSLLYDFIDRSDFYHNDVETGSRSRMNVPFFLEDESLNDRFVMEASAHGLFQLKGHRLQGGMRASLYNAMPIEGVKALVAFMRVSNRGIGDCTRPKLGNWAVMPYIILGSSRQSIFHSGSKVSIFLSMENY